MSARFMGEAAGDDLHGKGMAMRDEFLLRKIRPSGRKFGYRLTDLSERIGALLLAGGYSRIFAGFPQRDGWCVKV